MTYRDPEHPAATPTSTRRQIPWLTIFRFMMPAFFAVLGGVLFDFGLGITSVCLWITALWFAMPFYWRLLDWSIETSPVKTKVRIAISAIQDCPRRAKNAALRTLYIDDM